jgi:hypothetical protein
LGSAAIHAAQQDNQRIIQSTPTTFHLNPELGITEEKVRAPNDGMRTGAPHKHWPYVWWLILWSEKMH